MVSDEIELRFVTNIIKAIRNTLEPRGYGLQGYLCEEARDHGVGGWIAADGQEEHAPLHGGQPIVRLKRDVSG